MSKYQHISGTNVIIIGAAHSDKIPNVKSALFSDAGTPNDWCGILRPQCYSDNCYLCVWIDNVSRKKITISELNDTLYSNIEAVLVLDRSDNSCAIQNLCAKPQNAAKSLKELLTVILKIAKKELNYTVIFAVINIADSSKHIIENPQWDKIIDLYLDFEFINPCLYSECANIPFKYDYPFLGLIWREDVMITSAHTPTNLKNTIKYLKASYSKFQHKPTTDCMDGYTLKNFLAEGGYGVVSHVCDIKGKCQYAMKFQNIKDQGQRTRWEQEIALTKKLSVRFNIGPKFVGSWTCPKEDIGVIVTELWDGQLPPECITRGLINKLKTQIQDMHTVFTNPPYKRPGSRPEDDDYVVHGDIFEKNILIKKDSSGNIIDVTLTDFGVLQSKREWKTKTFTDDQGRTRSYLDGWFNDYVKKHPYIMEYYNDNHLTFKDVERDPSIMDNALVYYLEKHCRI